MNQIHYSHPHIPVTHTQHIDYDTFYLERCDVDFINGVNFDSLIKRSGTFDREPAPTSSCSIRIIGRDGESLCQYLEDNCICTVLKIRTECYDISLFENDLSFSDASSFIATLLALGYRSTFHL
jgi:hypothetical protein